MFCFFISLFYFIILFHYKKCDELTNVVIRTYNPDTLCYTVCIYLASIWNFNCVYLFYYLFYYKKAMN